MAGPGFPFFLYKTGDAPIPPTPGGFRSMLAFWAGGAANSGAVSEVAVTPSADGKRRRRWRSADEELTEEEAQYILRKLAELKAAKTAREEAAAARALELALAQATQDDEAAEIISGAIEVKHGTDYAEAIRDTRLMTQIANDLMRLAKELAAERERLADEDDVEVLLLL